MRKLIGKIIPFLFLVFGMTFKSFPKESQSAFRLHLIQEPKNINPALQTSSSSNYLLFNLFRNFFKFDENLNLVSDLGEKCIKSNFKLTCKLKKNLKWSDGSPLTAKDFISTYQWILSKSSKAPRADLLFSVKNAESFYLGNTTWENVGIKTIKENEIEFTFQENDLYFNEKLALNILSPQKNLPTNKENLVSNGPFKIKNWIPGEKIVLEKNSFYPNFQQNDKSHLTTPDVVFYMINDDSIAMKMYKKNELDFQRRVPTTFINEAKKDPNFLWIPVLRFDYIGLPLSLPKELRKLMIQNLDYSEWQKILAADPSPGCIGFPDSWITNKTIGCLKTELYLSKNSSFKDDFFKNKVKLIFSNQGGEDHKKVAEWIQNQWDKNLRLKLDIQPLENSLFLDELANSPPYLYRKGHALDTPHCFEAYKIFHSSHPENWLRLKNEKIDLLLKKLKYANNKSIEKNICSELTDVILNTDQIIPTGPIHFAMLLRKDLFDGVQINSLNQLDLSNIKIKK